MNKSKTMAMLLASLTCVTAASAQDGLVYAYDLRGTNELFTFDPANAGAGRTIIDDGTNADLYNGFAMDFNTAADTLYFVTQTFDLGTVSTTNGAFSPLASLSGDVLSDGGTVSGLKIDPTNETFYISTTSNLYTLNAATGATSLVGAFGANAGSMIDIAIDINGNMYGHDLTNDSLVSINKATGEATQIGGHGLAANFAQGMDFDYATNTLYAAIYTGSGTGQFVSWNLNDGSINSLFDTTPWNAELEMAIRSVPTPATAAALGMLGLASTRRRR